MFSIFTLNEADQWEAIVKSFSNYDVYYLPGYTNAFKLHGDGKPTLFYYQDDNIRAINVVMIRDVAEDERFKGKIDSRKFFDITTPYGYGGFLIEGSMTKCSLKKLDDDYTNYCRSKNIVSEFVRFHPVLENSKVNKQIYEITDLGKTITINLISKNQIWDDLSSKNRNVIRKAIKSGVQIFWSRDPIIVGEFIPLYNATMDSDEATNYYYFNNDFYNSILRDLKYNSLFFYAVYDGKIISSSIIIFGNDKINYHLSASDMEYRNLAATNLLLYEAACWGCENGYRYFHLGGGLGSKEDSLYKFKEAFNKHSDTYFSIGKKVFDRDKYDELVSIRSQDDQDIESSNFFPQYRK